MSPAAPTIELGQIRFIPLAYDSSDSESSALKLILTLEPKWASEDSNIEFIHFTDGITNTLLKAVNRRSGLSKADIDREAILLRAYGNGTAVLIDREREAANHELLMKNKLAPALLARFSNGMLYRFIPGGVCQAQDLQDPIITRAIARRLAEWHVKVPCIPDTSLKNGGADGNVQSNSVSKATIEKAAQGKPVPNLWSTIQKWLLALPVETPEQRQRQADLQKEFESLAERLSQRPGLGKNGLVFAHCDLLCANIIMHRDDEGQLSSVSFIDYEYATPSPAAFDVANHFAEFAGYDCDYAAIPTRSQRLVFVREYIETFSKLSGKNMNIEEETQKLMQQVDDYRGVPGFYWGIWAMIQATISRIKFDYASYAELRLSEYWACKHEQDGSRAGAGKELPLREKTWATD